MENPPLLDVSALIERSTQDLDWQLLLDRLSGMCLSPSGARRLRSRSLEDDWASARDCMIRSSECLSLANESLSLPAGGLPDLGDLVDRLELGAVATGVELRDLGRMLTCARELRLFMLSQRTSRPMLSRWLEVEQSVDRLGIRLEGSIDQDGQLRDEASAALRRARSRTRSARQELLGQLKVLMRKHADLMREQYYSEREGRYVIPIRSDAHRAVDGVVLDASASGNTLFIEPLELTQYSNQLRLAQAEVAHEEQRIFRELSAMGREMASELRQAENACIEADVLAAIARWGKACDAVAILPDSDPILELRAVRHPLLVGQGDVVPNDLAVSSGRALVLSGPNAGGKTVALKCLGLSARMARSGIPLCVDAGSRIGFFSSIYAEIGDSQSIVASLSTFSAHVLVLASILAHANENSLVLLDEVAGGTDPEQGAALATAYLEALLERGIAVAATTHYEALKELGNADERFQNAAVGFDVTSMLPTFRILNGVAGPSTALAVASRYGIPDAVVTHANSLIPDSSRKREHLLEELAAERSRAEQLRREAERDAAEQRQLRVELEEDRRQVRLAYQRQLEQEYHELLGRIRTARNDLDTVKPRLHRLDSGRREFSELERLVDGAAHIVAVGGEVAEAVRSNNSPEPAANSPMSNVISAGQRAHVARLGTDVEILESPRKGSVRVRAGSVTLQVDVAELSRCRQPQRPNKPPVARKPKKRSTGQEPASASSSRTTPTRTSMNTLDLRGERVDAALDRVDEFVDQLLRHGEPAGYVLHGHGTGVLKQAVRDHVRSLRQVVESSAAAPEDGGDAFTLLRLGD